MLQLLRQLCIIAIFVLPLSAAARTCPTAAELTAVLVEKYPCALPYWSFTQTTLRDAVNKYFKECATKAVVDQVWADLKTRLAPQFEAYKKGVTTADDMAEYMRVTGVLAELNLTKAQANLTLQRYCQQSAKPVPTQTLTPVEMPSKAIRFPSEFQETEAVVTAWPGYFSGACTQGWSVAQKLIEHVVKADPQGKVAKAVVVVPNSCWEGAARLYLTTKGATVTQMSRVKFLKVPTADVWMRDFGPTAMLSSNQPAIATAAYNPFVATPLVDDHVAQQFASACKVPYFRLPKIAFDGGNILTDGEGTIVMTNSIFEFNQGLTPQELEKTLTAFYGAKEVITVPWPTHEVTGHVDVVVKLLPERRALVGQAPESPWAADLDKIAQVLTSKRFSVSRIGMPSATVHDEHGFTGYSYVNALIVNGHVLVPTFRNAQEDAAALKKYRELLPKHDVVGIDFADFKVGGIHCQTKELPAQIYNACAKAQGW